MTHLRTHPHLDNTLTWLLGLVVLGAGAAAVGVGVMVWWLLRFIAGVI